MQHGASLPLFLAMLAAVVCIEPPKGACAVSRALAWGPKISVTHKDLGPKVQTLVGIEVPTIPGFACDVWCYEQAFDNRERGEAKPQPDGSMILTHTRGDTTVTTHVVPGFASYPGEWGGTPCADFNITVTGKTKDDVLAITSLNPCWQLRRAKGFSSDGKFVENFVNQCFIFTEKGFTLLKETTRFPDTRRPADDERNSPPWVQNYYPVWRRHPGQPEGFWGLSTDRPIYSLIGEVSRDGRYLTAFGCRRSALLGQGWHDCLHISPDMRDDYDEAANRITSRWRMYFMENDPARLLGQYVADMRPETSPLSVVARPDGMLTITSSEWPGELVTLGIGVLTGGGVARMHVPRRWEEQLWGAVSGGGDAPRSRYYVWVSPVADHVDLVVSVLNTSPRKINARVQASLNLAEAPGLARAEAGVGVVWEDGGRASAPEGQHRAMAPAVVGHIDPGELNTLRGRAYLTASPQADLGKTMAEDLAEWRLAVPFRRALPE
jgi:hypothetical protein